jgi:hypothetical protein
MDMTELRACTFLMRDPKLPTLPDVLHQFLQEFSLHFNPNHFIVIVQPRQLNDVEILIPGS